MRSPIWIEGPAAVVAEQRSQVWFRGLGLQRSVACTQHNVLAAATVQGTDTLVLVFALQFFQRFFRLNSNWNKPC